MTTRGFYGGIMWAVAVLALPALAFAGSGDLLHSYVEEFNAADDEHYTNAIPNVAAESFLLKNIPLLECSDKEIERIYYFRWWTYRKHLKRTADGWVVTEFLPPVPWAGAENTIVCPLGHHIAEGRWLRDPAITGEYLSFMMRKGAIVGERSYVSWPAWSYIERRKVVGSGDGLADFLPRFVERYEEWEKGWNFNGYPMRLDERDGLFYCADNREGMESSASGNGARPIVNAAMCAEAYAIARLAGETGDADVRRRYEGKAEVLLRNLKRELWDEKLGFFVTKSDDGKRVSTREIQGYAPWYFNLPVGPCFASSWVHLMDSASFYGKFGLTTVERSSPTYKIVYEGRPCQWNGPSWPYVTSMTLTALANAIRMNEAGDLAASDFVRLLQQYAFAHRRRRLDGKVVSWIDENLDPDTGIWIAREILMKRGDRPIERGKDYNHSSFCDIVISDLAGFKPECDGSFSVVPLIPSSWDVFRLTGVPWCGHLVDIIWEHDVLCVMVDGRVAARRRGVGVLRYDIQGCRSSRRHCLPPHAPASR